MSIKGTLIATLAAGYFATAIPAAHAEEKPAEKAPKGEKAGCKGKDGCKGKAGCKGKGEKKGEKKEEKKEEAK